MNRGTMVGLLAAVLSLGVWATWWSQPAAYAQGERQMTNAQPISVIRLEAGDRGDHIVVLDPNSQVMCTYYITRETGAITLRSVRRVSWDLQLDEYNPSTPTPNDIRAVIEGR